jgi:hypothetical protein
VSSVHPVLQNNLVSSRLVSEELVSELVGEITAIQLCTVAVRSR